MSSQRPLTAVALSLGLSIAALEILPRFVDIPGLTTRDLNPIKFELSKANIAPMLVTAPISGKSSALIFATCHPAPCTA